MTGLKRLLQEVHQRSLWQALAVYLGAAFATLEAVDLFIDYFAFPRWLFPVAFFCLVVGLPVVVVTSLAKEEIYGDQVQPADAGAAAKEDRQLRFLTWRNAGLSFLAAWAFWGMAVAGWLLLGGPDSGGEALPIEDTRVAVFPFSYSGSADFAYLEEGIASLLATHLDGAGDLTTTDNQALLALMDQQGGTIPDPEGARSIAGRLGAGSFILGNVVEVGGELQMAAVLYSPGNDYEGSSATAQGGQDELFALVEELAVELLVGESEDPAAQLTPIAAATTDSLDALKAYLRGEQALRVPRGAGSAMKEFQRAVQIDSTFALAWYKLAYVAGWNWQYMLSYEAGQHAIAHSKRLPPRYRQLLDAFWAHRRGAADESEELYRIYLARYPNDLDAWYGYGLVLYHYNPLRGRPVGEAIQPLQRVLQFKPTHPGPAALLFWTAALEQLPSLLDSMFVLLYGDTSKLPPVLRYQRDLFLGDTTAAGELVRLSNSDSGGDLVLSSRLLFGSGFPAEAAQVARTAVSRESDPGERDRARLYIVHSELARGRWSAAKSELDSLARTNAAWALEYRALLASLPFVNAPESELWALRDRLLQWDAAGVPTNPHPSFQVNVHNGVHKHIRLYLLARLEVLLGNETGALDYASVLDTMAVPPTAGSLAQDMAQGIRAEVAWQQGMAPEALAALEQAPREVPIWRAWPSPFFSQSYERYLHAQVLAALGRYEEALAWMGPTHMDYVEPYEAVSHLLRAEIYERLGDLDQARHHYGRFIELWKDANPELQPRVEAARRAIEALSTDR